MQYAQHKPTFDADGFVVVRQFLPIEELSDLQKHLDRYIREVVPTLEDAHAFYVDRARPETLKQMQHMGIDPYFREYARHPRWAALATTLLGEEATALEPEWFNKPPGTNHPTPPHQDNYYFNLTPPQVLTIWLALDPVDDANGCLQYVRGSHLQCVRPHGASNIVGFSQGITDFGPQDEANEVRVHLSPGDAVAHWGNTIHRARPNQTPDRHRRAFAMVFRGVSCRRDEAGYARYLASLKSQHQSLGLQT
ncbi:MAG: phytanoyl-CoA dioxygenase family protein [Gemmataceae bacterium]